jgi:hypothetical protein
MPTTRKFIASLPISGTHVGSFTSIPQTFTDLLVVGVSRVSNSAVTTPLSVQFNNSGGTAYSTRRLYGGDGVAGSDSFSGNPQMLLGFNNTGLQTANTFSSTEIYISNYSSTTVNKSVSCTSVMENNASGSSYIVASAGLWANTSAITLVTLFDNNAFQFVSGTQFFLYGITKA